MATCRIRRTRIGSDIALLALLGNPGRDYVHTRHNIGFMLAGNHPGIRSLVWREKFHGDYATLLADGRKIHVLKPATFMNRSGISVAAATTFFKLDPSGVLVVHDELELPFGTIGFRFGGGLGGHNGLRSIAERVGTRDFARLRIGIGRPRGGTVSGYVLSQFNTDEKALLERILDGASELLDEALSGACRSETKRQVV